VRLERLDGAARGRCAILLRYLLRIFVMIRAHEYAVR